MLVDAFFRAGESVASVLSVLTEVNKSHIASYLSLPPYASAHAALWDVLLVYLPPLLVS